MPPSALALAIQFHNALFWLLELDPSPKTELAYSTPFELLVAVILSAQATDVGVNKATKRLFPVANTPAKLVALGETGLKRYISSIGLYNAKAANVIAMSHLLLQQHDGEVNDLGVPRGEVGHPRNVQRPMTNVQ